MASSGLYGQSADSILKVVEEYNKLDKGMECLELIYTFVVENQTRIQWSQELEKLLQIMIELSVNFRKHDMLDENLKIYKKICEKHNFESIHIIFTHYIKCLQNKFNDSIKKIDNVEELFEELKSQNDSQTFFFNSMDAKQGKQKEQFKVNWRLLLQGYRNVLNFSYQNKNLLKIYYQFGSQLIDLLVLHKASYFYSQFCSFFYDHQQKLIKNQKKVSMNLKILEINKKFIELRKKQFEGAQKLGLNQESFEILEVLNYLLFCRKSLYKDLSYYYLNLANIFQKGGFYVFHSLALKSNFRTQLKLKVPQEDLQKLADKIVLATLAINNNSEEFFLSSELLQKYSFLLPNEDLKINIQNLLQDLNNDELIHLCQQNIKDLFNACIGYKDIYDFSNYVEKGLKNLDSDLKIYDQSIRENSIQIVLQLLSQYFTNINFEELKEFTHFEDFGKVKNFIQMNIFNQSFKMKINYKEELIEFLDGEQIQNRILLQKRNYSNQVQTFINLSENMLFKQQDQLKELEENFIIYYENQDGINESFEELVKLEESQIVVKIKQQIENKISEQEKKRNQMIQKEADKQEQIERKMLKEKQIIIDQIIKEEPLIKLGGKYLKDYNDEEKVQINYNFFFKLKDNLKEKKILKTKAILNKKFDRQDYYIREKQKGYFQNEQKFFIENQVDMEEIKKQLQQTEEIEKAQQQNFKAAQNFLRKYQQRKQEEANKKYKEEYAEYKKKIKESIVVDIIKKTDQEIKNLEEQKKKEELKNRQFNRQQQQTDRRPQMNRERGQFQNQQQNQTQQQQPTKLSKGSDFQTSQLDQRQKVQQPTRMAQRGQLLSNQKPLQRGDGKSENTLQKLSRQTLQRGNNEKPPLQRGTGEKPILQRGTGEKTLGDKKLTRGQLGERPQRQLGDKKPTQTKQVTLTRKGQDFKKNK